MSETLNFFVAVGLGIGLVSVFTGLGAWVGYQLGKAAAPPVNRALALQVERLYQELAFCAKLGDFAGMQAQQLYTWAVQSALVPSEMQTTLHQLMATHKAMNERLQKAGEGTRRSEYLNATQAAPANERRGSTAKASRQDLSATELGRFTQTEQRQIESDGQADRRRYSYGCLQQMLEWEDPAGPWPSVFDTVAVRCHDISLHGVSFYWPDDPDFKYLLSSLGSEDDLIFMACEIVRSKPVYMHGEWQYVVSCRFLKRMKEFTEHWRQHCESPDVVAEESSATLATAR
jgi:hypothetical protein